MTDRNASLDRCLSFLETMPISPEERERMAKTFRKNAATLKRLDREEDERNANSRKERGMAW